MTAVDVTRLPLRQSVLRPNTRQPLQVLFSEDLRGVSIHAKLALVEIFAISLEVPSFYTASKGTFQRLSKFQGSFVADRRSFLAQFTNDVADALLAEIFTGIYDFTRVAGEPPTQLTPRMLLMVLVGPSADPQATNRSRLALLNIFLRDSFIEPMERVEESLGELRSFPEFGPLELGSAPGSPVESDLIPDDSSQHSLSDAEDLLLDRPESLRPLAQVTFQSCPDRASPVSYNPEAFFTDFMLALLPDSAFLKACQRSPQMIFYSPTEVETPFQALKYSFTTVLKVMVTLMKFSILGVVCLCLVALRRVFTTWFYATMGVLMLVSSLAMIIEYLWGPSQTLVELVRNSPNRLGYLFWGYLSWGFEVLYGYLPYPIQILCSFETYRVLSPWYWFKSFPIEDCQDSPRIGRTCKALYVTNFTLIRKQHLESFQKIEEIVAALVALMVLLTMLAVFLTMCLTISRGLGIVRPLPKVPNTNKGGERPRKSVRHSSRQVNAWVQSQLSHGHPTSARGKTTIEVNAEGGGRESLSRGPNVFELSQWFEVSSRNFSIVLGLPNTFLGTLMTNNCADLSSFFAKKADAQRSIWSDLVGMNESLGIFGSLWKHFDLMHGKSQLDLFFPWSFPIFCHSRQFVIEDHLFDQISRAIYRLIWGVEAIWGSDDCKLGKFMSPLRDSLKSLTSTAHKLAEGMRNSRSLPGSHNPFGLRNATTLLHSWWSALCKLADFSEDLTAKFIEWIQAYYLGNPKNPRYLFDTLQPRDLFITLLSLKQVPTQNASPTSKIEPCSRCTSDLAECVHTVLPGHRHHLEQSCPFPSSLRVISSRGRPSGN
jgi:hypothetical protein